MNKQVGAGPASLVRRRYVAQSREQQPGETPEMKRTASNENWMRIGAITITLVLMIVTSAAANDEIRIMPLGNSITKGTAGSDLDIGYRRALFLALTDAGYDVDFVGTQFHGLVDDFDRDHEGHGGWEADEIRDNIYGWLVLNPADYVLLHIGTNDVSHNHVDVSEVDQLLDNIDQFEADYTTPVTVLAARIILRADGNNSTTIAYNDSVEALVLDRIGEGDDLVVVHMDTALTYPDDLIDNVHPNQSGYDKMAAVWFNHLNDILPYTACPEEISHYWKLDETDGDVYIDSWGGLDGECVDCPSPVGGVVESAQYFGSETLIYFEDDDTYEWGADQSFTIESWVKVDSISLDGLIDPYHVIIGRGGHGLSPVSWQLRLVGKESMQSGVAAFQLSDLGTTVDLVGVSDIADGDWHHIAATRDHTTDSVLLYVDGALEDSSSAVFSSGFADTSGIYVAASGPDPMCCNFPGTIDEIALYSRALNAHEITGHVASGLNGNPYCAGSSAPYIVSAPITSIGLGQNYIYNVQADGDPDPVFALVSGPAGMSIDTVTGLVEWQPSSSGVMDVTVSATNVAGSDEQFFQIEVYEPPPCPEGMSHYWMLNEQAGPMYSDEIGGNSMFCASCPVSTAGVSGLAQEFNGSTEADIADDNTFDWGPDQSFSIEFWIYKNTDCTGNTNAENNVIVGRYGSGTGGLNIWWVGVNCNSSEGTQGGIRFVLRDNGDSGTMIVSSQSIVGTGWHHVVAMRDDKNSLNKLYIDGDLAGSISYNYTEGFDDLAEINIGYLGFGDHFRLNGALDELALYDRALDEAEIENHYANGLAGHGYCYFCGDVDGSGGIDIDDIVFLIAYVFAGGAPPNPLSVGDVDCSDSTDIDDVVYLVAYIFAGGPVPCADCE